MGVIDDTGFSILSNTYGFPSRHSGLGSKVLGDGFGHESHSFPGVLRNLSTTSRQCLINVSAISRLPIGIFLLLSGASSTRPVGDEQAGLTFPCQQWYIAPSFSRLHGISLRATVRRNAGEPFLLVHHCSARRCQQDSYRRFERVSCIGCP